MTTDVSMDYKLLGFLREINGRLNGWYDIHSACVHGTWPHPGAHAEGLHCGSLLHKALGERRTFILGRERGEALHQLV